MSTSSYNPCIQGTIIAVRIYRESELLTSAELAFTHGKTIKIPWSSVDQRNKFKEGITEYTLFYDERCRCPFKCIADKQNDNPDVLNPTYKPA